MIKTAATPPTTPPTIGPTLLEEDDDEEEGLAIRDDEAGDDPPSLLLDAFFSQYVLGHCVHVNDVVTQYSSSAHLGQETLLSHDTQPFCSDDEDEESGDFDASEELAAELELVDVLLLLLLLDDEFSDIPDELDC